MEIILILAVSALLGGFYGVGVAVVGMFVLGILLALFSN